MTGEVQEREVPQQEALGDRASGKQLVSIAHEKHEGTIHKLSRRTMAQAWHRVETLLDYAFSFRDAERKVKHLDNVSALTEAIYHLKQAQVHLRRVSLRLYSSDPVDLDVYRH